MVAIFNVNFPSAISLFVFVVSMPLTVTLTMASSLMFLTRSIPLSLCFSIGSRLDSVSFPVRFLLKCLFVKFLRALFVITILFL